MHSDITKIPIVLHTIDSYSEYWDTWYSLFKKHMVNYGPIYFLSEEKEPSFIKEINHIKTGKGEWGERLINGLKKIDSELFFYMQEDFWVHKPTKLENKILDDFINYSMDAYRISFISKWYKLEKVDENLFKYHQHSNYTLSHQFTLWRKDFLLKFIKPNQNPWVNEIDGSREMNKNTHRIFLTENDFYTPSVTKGEINDKGLKILKQFDL